MGQQDLCEQLRVKGGRFGQKTELSRLNPDYYFVPLIAQFIGSLNCPYRLPISFILLDWKS